MPPAMVREAGLAPQAPPPSPTVGEGALASEPRERSARSSARHYECNSGGSGSAGEGVSARHYECNSGGSGSTGEGVAGADDSGLQEARTELIGAEYGSFMEATVGASSCIPAPDPSSSSMPPLEPPPPAQLIPTARRADARTQTMPPAGVDASTQTPFADAQGSGPVRARATPTEEVLRARRRRQQAEDRYQLAMRLIRKAARKRKKRRMQGATAPGGIGPPPMLMMLGARLSEANSAF